MITLMKNTTMFNGVLRGFTNNYWDFVFKLGVLYKLFSNVDFMPPLLRIKDTGCV